jgi:peroxiredoxin
VNKQVVPSLAAAAVVVAGVWLMSSSTRPMPEVVFNLLDGRTLHSADLRGKSVLINFWSVSCEVCLRDMPRLTRLHETMEEHGFLVIGVAVPHDPPATVIGVVEKLEPAYPIALDVHGEVSKAFGGIKVTPTTYLVGPDGNINYSERGTLDETRIRATVLTFQR